MLTARRLRRAAASARQDRAADDYAPNRHDFQTEVVPPAGAGDAGAALEARAHVPSRSSRRRTHPVEDDPDLERAPEGRGAGRAGRARGRRAAHSRAHGRSQSVARDFDRVLRVLENWGYVDGWTLTDAGKILARTFHECDLLIVECAAPGSARRPRAGARWPAWCRCSSTSTAARSRRRRRGSRRRRVRKRWQRIAEISYELRGDRGGGRAGRAPPAGSDVRRRRLRVGRRGGLRRGRRGRGAVRRRLRAHDEAADRPAAPAGARRARSRRHARVPPSRPPTQLFRGVVAASSAVEIDRRRTGSRPDRRAAR